MCAGGTGVRVNPSFSSKGEISLLECAAFYYKKELLMNSAWLNNLGNLQEYEKLSSVA